MKLSFQAVRVTTFEAARCLRAILEFDGIPAMAAEVELDGQAACVVMTFAPAIAAQALAPLANAWSKEPDWEVDLKTSQGALTSFNIVPVVERDAIRATLHAAAVSATNMPNRGGRKLVRVEADPVSTTAPKVNHDGGDEDDAKPQLSADIDEAKSDARRATEFMRTVVTHIRNARDQRPTLRDMARAGRGGPVEYHDAFDGWKPAR